jgi:enoyl-CoA hydratase/carnithine racemase
MTELAPFTIDERVPGYWRVVFSNPPINLVNSTTVLELAEIVRQIEEAPDLRVVVFASEHPEFFMARYDLSDTNPVAFAPTESGVTLFIDSMLRLNDAGPITIASIRGRARGGGSEFVLSCDLRFASLENSDGVIRRVGAGHRQTTCAPTRMFSATRIWPSPRANPALCSSTSRRSASKAATR